MPKASKKKSTRKSSKHRASSKKSRRVRKVRVKIHTFKGIINGGTLVSPASGTAITTWGGVYTWDMNTLPIYANMMSLFEFARVNSVKFELMPRANVSAVGSASTVSTATGTIIVGIDEAPLSSTAGKASTWVSSASEDGAISEAFPQASTLITPDYLRGMENSSEVEIYKKIVRSFVPAAYVITNLAPSTFNPTSTMGVAYEQRKRTWWTCQTQSSSASALTSPVFWGLMYAFCNAPINADVPTYDVRIHYSISFKRLRGA